MDFVFGADCNAYALISAGFAACSLAAVVVGARSFRDGLPQLKEALREARAQLREARAYSRAVRAGLRASRLELDSWLDQREHVE